MEKGVGVCVFLGGGIRTGIDEAYPRSGAIATKYVEIACCMTVKDVRFCMVEVGGLYMYVKDNKRRT